MSLEQQLGLELNLPRVQAQQRLHDGKFDPDDWDGVYKLVMQAYDDRELAEKEQLAAMWRVVHAETEAARLRSGNAQQS